MFEGAAVSASCKSTVMRNCRVSAMGRLRKALCIVYPFCVAVLVNGPPHELDDPLELFRPVAPFPDLVQSARRRLKAHCDVDVAPNVGQLN